MGREINTGFSTRSNVPNLLFKSRAEVLSNGGAGNLLEQMADRLAASPTTEPTVIILWDDFQSASFLSALRQGRHESSGCIQLFSFRG